MTASTPVLLRDPDALRGALQSGTQRLFEAFWPASRATAFYARAKGRADPVYLEALHRVPPGASLLDVGGGQGILTLLHALVHGGGQRRTVVDWDARKVALGRGAAERLGLEVEFVEGDVHELELPTHDAVLLVDVLHYVPADHQDRLLRRLAGRVGPEGLLLIRDVDGGLGWRSWMTALQERFSLLLRISLGGGLHLRPARAIVAILEAEGLQVEVEPAWGRTPFANVLISARRPG